MTVKLLHGFYDTTLKNRGGQKDASAVCSVGNRMKLRELEDELGTPLVDPRDENRTELTLAGKLIFQCGETMFGKDSKNEKVRELL